ncbi:MAG: GTP cyclohydrolase I FolE [Desulfovibrionaceae bacterium]|nr:GTP cyclohydrolase I FolE [Desulfovibrionaceae bacterium]
MIDQEKIRTAVKLFLEGIGEDPHREGLCETPNRVARMCDELFGGYQHSASEHLKAQFSTPHNGLVLEKNISFYSICEHHLLPFFGQIHLAYIPAGRVLGLSKLARTVEVFARRLQIQETLGYQIAQAIMQGIHPKGVMVVICAQHMCMSMRGINKDSALTKTVACLGCFEQDQVLMNSCMRELLPS